VKKYYFKVHPALYVFLIFMVGLGIYEVIVDNFYFAYTNIVVFGIPLLLLATIQLFKLNTLEIHQEKIVFGFFKRITILKKDIIKIELLGNKDINNIHIMIEHLKDGEKVQSNLLKTYHVKLIVIYYELLKFFENDHD